MFNLVVLEQKFKMICETISIHEAIYIELKDQMNNIANKPIIDHTTWPQLTTTSDKSNKPAVGVSSIALRRNSNVSDTSVKVIASDNPQPIPVPVTGLLLKNGPQPDRDEMSDAGSFKFQRQQIRKQRRRSILTGNKTQGDAGFRAAPPPIVVIYLCFTCIKKLKLMISDVTYERTVK